MPILLSEGLPTLLSTIQGNLRHQDYEHVVKIAKDFTIYGTGTGVEEKLARFHGGETEELFTQRKILTMTNVADIFNSCVKPLNKVGMTPANISISWEGKDAAYNIANKKKIEEVASDFWGDKSVKTYLTRRMGPIDSMDPNSFLVVEFKEDVKSDDPDSRAQPYPFEVNSKEAINFIYKNNILQWLIVLNDSPMLDQDGKVKPGEKYYIYLDNQTVSATQIHSKTVDTYLELNPDVILLKNVENFDSLVPKNKYLFATNEEGDAKRYYVLSVFNHLIGFVPARRFGTESDPLTRHRTCVPVINPAKSYFEDSIQTMSEFSITKRLHTFPQKWQYLPKCDAPGCYKGYGADGIAPCGTCKGTGTITHSSAQDIIGIKMPEELKDVINLDMMATYKGPPIDLVKFQKEFGFEDIRRYAQSAVYNNEVGRRRVKTATETEIDAEAVNATIKPFGDNWSDMFTFVYYCIAELSDLGENFDCEHSFPDDFQIQTLSEILDDLKKANETGAESHIKKALTKKLTNKIYIDQPREILKIDTKDKYFPYAGKTDAEIQFILANGKTTKYAETLYSHFDLIFSDLEFEYSSKKLDFYQLDEKLQREAIKKKVDEYIALIESGSSMDNQNSFGENGGVDINTPTDIEAEAKAKLKGTVGGVQGILEIQKSVGEGTTDYESAITLLNEIYGYDDSIARKILGTPKKIITTVTKPVI